MSDCLTISINSPSSVQCINGSDGYLSTNTWHSTGAAEDKQFFRAIAPIVYEPGFDAQAMGEYMRQHETYAADPRGHFDKKVEQRVIEASAISDCLKLKL